MQKNVIITGATSFIGLALLRRLSDMGGEVYAIARPGSSRLAFIPKAKNIHLIEAELSSLAGLSLPAERCDSLLHVGWFSDFLSPRFNLEGQVQNAVYTEQAVSLAHKSGCSTFLGVGSQAECGRVSGCITPETPAKPENAYAAAKVFAAQRAQDLCEQYGIKFCWPRLLSAYGPFERPHTLIMSCIQACLDGSEMEMTGCAQIWDYIYIDDVADAIVRIAEKGKHGKRYPIGSGVGRSLRSYVEEIAGVIGNDVILRGIGKRPYADDQVMNLLADMCETTADTGFVCQTAFAGGIRKTIEYIKNHPGS